MIPNRTTHNTLGSETPSAKKKKKYLKPKKQNMGKLKQGVLTNATVGALKDGQTAPGQPSYS